MRGIGLDEARMSIISTTKMTARQFLELGEDPPGVRLELVNGEVAVSPSPIPDQSYTENKLATLLTVHIDERKLGILYRDVDTIFGEFDVRRPDLIFFSTQRLHLVGAKAMEGSPDLCVEILSPSSKRIDRGVKFKQYEKGGVRFYWIVDPAERTIEAFRLSRGKFNPVGKGAGSDVVNLQPFEELDISLARLWHPLIPPRD
jgi:Uma2 family endonuclease